MENETVIGDLGGGVSPGKKKRKVKSRLHEYECRRLTWTTR